MDTLQLVAALMGVLVALITLIIIIIGGLGFFEIRRWRGARKSLEKEVKKATEKSKKAAAIVDGLEKLKEKAQITTPPLTEKPSKEIKEKLDEHGRRLEFLEILGVPLKPKDYYNRGVDFYYKGKYELALKFFEKAIEIEPDVADTWVGKGIALDRLGHHNEALKAYEKATEIKSNYIDAWIHKGVTLHDLGRYNEALEACEKVTEIRPNSAMAWYNKGVMLGKLGRYGEALESYKKAIDITPHYSQAWYNLAGIYSLKGDKENALKHLSKAIELNKEYKEDAKKDEDFKNFWDDENFKALVQ